MAQASAQSNEAEARRTLKRKRIIAIASLLIAAGLIVWLSIYITKAVLSLEEGESIGDAAKHFRDMIHSRGAWGVLIAFGIQVLQVIVSPIPGEVIETGMGITYGPFWGTVIILAGAAFSSWLIMLFVRKWGTKFVELFISLDKINDLRFINSEKKLNRWVLILYMLPGTPKDPLIFFFGLTKIKISTFVLLSTVARIPSVVTSTIGGHWIHKKEYFKAILLYVIIGAVSLACLLLYKKIMDKLKRRGENEEAPPAEDAAGSAADETTADDTKEKENEPDNTQGL